MLEMLLGKSMKPTIGLTGNVYGRTQKSITGNGMRLSGDGKYLASGYSTANSGTGEVYISDLRTLSAPFIKRVIRLPDWKPGSTAGTFSRAGHTVRGNRDLSVIMANTQADGFDKGAIYVMDLDSDHAVTASSKIYPAGSGSGDYFSQYCDMSDDGNFIVASSVGYNSFIGRVYIYNRVLGNWVLEKTLDRPAGEQCVRFGLPVTISANGEFMATSALPSAAAGSSRVFLYKRNGGSWNLVSTINDTRSISGAGRISGYVSPDGKKLCVAYSYNSSTAGTPEGGIDIYDINQTTGATSLIANVTNGIAGGGYNVQPFFSYDGSTFLGSPCLPVGNQYDGLQCIQFNPETQQYERSWSFTTTAIAKYPVYPVTNDAATMWAAACPNLVLLAQDSFFVGR